MPNAPKKILIATPLFPPAIGGPASYSENLARELEALDWPTSVLTYGSEDVRKYARQSGFEVLVVSSSIISFVKHFFYAAKALKLLRRSSAVLVFDPFIVGLPVAAANFFARKPMIARVEGDFLWEMYVERTGWEVALRDFYRRLGAMNLNIKEKFIYGLAGWVYGRSDILVFSSRWRRDIFASAYPRVRTRTVIIESLWPVTTPNQKTREKVILYAGRFIRIKNIARLTRAFVKSLAADWQLEIIGEGPEKAGLKKLVVELGAEKRVIISPPLPRSALLEKVASVRALALPSISDVSPNVILDCISSGTPFIMTRESGFFEKLKDRGIFVDPLDESSIEAGLRQIADEANYSRLVAGFSRGGVKLRQQKLAPSPSEYGAERNPAPRAFGSLPPPSGRSLGLSGARAENRSWSDIARDWAGLIADTAK